MRNENEIHQDDINPKTNLPYTGPISEPQFGCVEEQPSAEEIVGESQYAPETEKGTQPDRTHKAAKPSVSHGGEHTTSSDGTAITKARQSHVASNRKATEKIFDENRPARKPVKPILK